MSLLPKFTVMNQSPLAAAITDLAAPLAASLGLELWGVELAFSGRGLVRVFVESENGVSVDQCAELSRLLGLSLDVEDLVPGAYVLEVSSPGLERTFFTEAQLARAVGQRVEITLHEPRPAWPGRRKFRGLLQGAPGIAPQGEDALPEAGGQTEHDQFLLKAEDVARPGEEEPLVAFAFADVKKAAQVHFFPEQALPGKKNQKKHVVKKTVSPKPKAGASDDGAEHDFNTEL